MRGRTFVLAAVLGTAISSSTVAFAQLSPQGILNGITRPFRHALGHFGHYHYPRFHRHHTASVEPRGAITNAPAEPSVIAGSRFGVSGPPAWPTALEDMAGFTLWPDGYVSRLRGHAFAVIADTISGRSDLSDGATRTATTGAAATDGSGSIDRCGGTTDSRDSWPATRVQQILQLSDAQHDALEKLQAAMTQSAKNIGADCHGSGALAPPDRLRALVQALWAVHDAGISLQTPLRNFYDALTPTQKNSFVSYQPQSSPPSDPKAANAGMSRQYQDCAMQNSEKAERLIKEIEMRIRPNKNQAASLENLHKTSTDMAKLLIASCAQPVPADPLARLDAANDQLTALTYAATAVEMVFDGFYAELNNDQRMRFDSLAR